MGSLGILLSLEAPAAELREKGPAEPKVALALRSSIFLRSISSCVSGCIRQIGSSIDETGGKGS